MPRSERQGPTRAAILGNRARREAPTHRPVASAKAPAVASHELRIALPEGWPSAGSERLFTAIIGCRRFTEHLHEEQWIGGSIGVLWVGFQLATNDRQTRIGGQPRRWHPNPQVRRVHIARAPIDGVPNQTCQASGNRRVLGTAAGHGQHCPIHELVFAHADAFERDVFGKGEQAVKGDGQLLSMKLPCDLRQHRWFRSQIEYADR